MLAQLAQTYREAPAVTPSDLELALLELWIQKQYQALPVHTSFTCRELMLAEAMAHYIETGNLLISVAHISHPFLSDRLNAMFRAIHDWHHIIGNVDDSLTGEVCAYRIARDSAPHSIWWMLFSEIVLQAAACIDSGSFQQQKLVRL